MDIAAFKEQIQSRSSYVGQLKGLHREAEKAADSVALPQDLPLPLVEALAKLGIRQLYRHQADAWEAHRRGRSRVLSTGTASGKSLSFLLPVLDSLLKDPSSRAILIYPTKALSQDQLRKIEELCAGSPELMASVRPHLYDGDTPGKKRTVARREANLLLTNPDMLHVSVLPSHGRWGEFFYRLRHVVIDEAHIYHGIFGSHMALVLARLKRLCERVGAKPVWSFATATIANPAELAQALSGESVELLDQDGSGKGAKELWIWRPEQWRGGKVVPGSTYEQTVDLAARLMVTGRSLLIFARTRLQCELLARYLKEKLIGLGAPESWAGSYRAGYTPQERRRIEAALSAGEIRALVATSALELGVDVGHLDAVLAFGFPGSFASFRQRIGRAGRAGQESLSVLVASSHPLDQYMSHHPEFLFRGEPEAACLDAGNPYILKAHLLCAAFEFPLRTSDSRYFGAKYESLVNELIAAGKLKRVAERTHYRGGVSPALGISLRSLSGERYKLLNVEDLENPLGELDERERLRNVHQDTVQMIRGQTYRVVGVAEEEREIHLLAEDLDYFTVPRTQSHLEWREIEESRKLGPMRGRLGLATQRAIITGYKLVRFHTGALKGEMETLKELPPLDTRALFWELDAGLMELLDSPLGALAGLRHLMEECLASVALVDKGDLQVHVDVQSGDRPGIAVVEVYPEGIGLVQRVWSRSPALLRFAQEVLASCDCELGCPACIGVEPFEISRTERIPPHKASTRLLLSRVLESPPGE